MLKRLIIALMVAFICVAPPVLAQEKETEKKQKPTPVSQWVEAENKLLDTLGKPNQKTFFIFRNKHSVMRSIEIVRRDIQNAVKACGKANPNLKKDMNKRFKSWEKAVLPILKTARKFLDTELKEQDAFHVSDYHHVMKLNDKAYEYSESKIEKTPVTTVEACEGLLASMDRTEDKLIGLLQEILLPEEVVRKRLERAEAQ
ncbi:MAG: hypothetical protein MRY79_01870 [Alphaproteobacteria bacterium]|nr:hypothetical protein [Alphaproteobacteria bacterium]